MNYIDLAMKTAPISKDYRYELTGEQMILLNGAVGLAGESGEVADLIKKHVFQFHDLDKDMLIDELGDIFWYLALISDVLNVTFEEIMSKNISKLKARYPDGFTSENSINR